MDAELRALGSYDQRMQMIESWDVSLKAEFLSDDVLVVYYTGNGNSVPDSKEPSGGLRLVALFFDSRSGALSKKLEWTTRVRVGRNDFIDPEARLYAAHNRQFIVYASDNLMVYGSDFSLLYEKSLQPLRWRDDRSVQVLPGGKQIFVEEKVAGSVKHSWFAVDGLRPVPTPPGVLRQAGGVVASETSLYPGGIVPTWKGDVAAAEKYHISDCPMSPLSLARDQVLWSGYCGFTVNQGASNLWVRRIGDEAAPAQNDEPRRNLPGNRFMLNYVVGHRSKLDDVHLSKKGTLIVYDVATCQPVFSMEGLGGMALSPDGSQIAAFKNAMIQIYRITEQPNTGARSGSSAPSRCSH